MLLLLIILAVICLWKAQFLRFNSAYLSKEQTTAVKGIFTVFVFLSHIRGYLSLSYHPADQYYNFILNYMGQLMVVAFFFYSGFGIWHSFKTKKDYEKSFLKKRLFKTWLHFAIAVALFILVQLFLQTRYTTRQYIGCWIGWESVGNSNWFVFVILALYLIAYCALAIERRVGKGGIALATLLSVILWIFLHYIAQKPSWWIDTMASFPLGMIAAQYKDRLDSFIRKYKVHPFFFVLVFSLISLIWRNHIGIDIYGGLACIFCMLIVSVSMWLRVGNPILDWLGKNVFTIYIIQRLPMLSLSAFGINEHRLWFIVLSIVFTGVLAEGLSRLYKAIDSKLF